jgi:hypothetical protein
VISRECIFSEASLSESFARPPESGESAPEADDPPDTASAAVPAAIMKSRRFISPVDEVHRFDEFSGSVIFLQTQRLASTSQHSVPFSPQSGMLGWNRHVIAHLF